MGGRWRADGGECGEEGGTAVLRRRQRRLGDGGFTKKASAARHGGDLQGEDEGLSRPTHQMTILSGQDKVWLYNSCLGSYALNGIIYTCDNILIIHDNT